MGEENVTNEQLVARIQAGIDVPDNMLRLWQQNQGYIGLIAKNYQAFEDIEDLKQEGYIGLCRAVDEYKPQEGIAFMTYAGYWIRQQMQRYVENCSSVVRVPSHAREKLRKRLWTITGKNTAVSQQMTSYGGILAIYRAIQ